MLVRTRQNWIGYATLIGLLGVLLWFSPAEATLGNVVKLVYAHGAAQRVAMYAYLGAGALGFVTFATRRNSLLAWVRALMETALVFWFVQIVVSLPAQMLAWGGIAWTEPRVLNALWVLGFTMLVYGVARWVGDVRWLPAAAIANAIIPLILLRGAANILHPLDPILSSDSPAIKIFYAAIVLTTGALALVFARGRAREGS